MSLKIFSITIFALCICFISCNDASEEQKNNEAIDSAIVQSEKIVTLENESDVSYNLPSALQIAYVFKKSGAGFSTDLLNKTANVSKYNTGNFKRAAAFGIYSSDLAYCMFNKKYQESKEYLKACKDVGSYLGINQAFESNDMAQRFDKNITIEDSVVKIVSNVQLRTDIMFEQNKQKHITVIAFAGAWTESIYIASQIYAKEKNKKVLVSLLEQLLLSETIVKALKINSTKEPEIAQLITSIEAISQTFNGFNEIKKSSATGMDIDFNLVSVSEDEFSVMLKSIVTLRSNLIN
jgi:hypothetical protein